MSLSLREFLQAEAATATSQPSLPVNVDIFSGTRGSRSARVMIVGEAWGDSERAAGKPFVGASGRELESMLREAGIDPDDCFYTNLVNEKPNANDMRSMLYDNKHKGSVDPWFGGIKPLPRLIEGLRRLDAQIEAVKPVIIIATGNWPLWYLTGKGTVKTSKGYKMPTGIDTWRGSQLFLRPSPFRSLFDIPVLAVYHPAAILRMYSWRKITTQDLRRCSDYLTGRSWKDLGALERLNIIRPSAKELATYINAWIRTPEKAIVCDLETKQFRPHIIGLTQDGKTNIAIPFFAITPDGFRPLYAPLEFRDVYKLLIKLFSTPGMRFVGQNWAYDVQYIIKFFFCRPTLYWDTMVAQHVAFPALRKGLDFLASMYCTHYVYWKDDLKESTDNMDWEAACAYNCEDLWRTYEVWQTQETVLAVLNKTHLMRQRMEVWEAAVDMMEDGVRVDAQMKQAQRTKLLLTAQAIGFWLESVMPDHLKPHGKDAKPWFSSPQHLGYILYDCLKLKPVIDRQSGSRTTNKEALVWLSERYPQWAGLLSAILLLRSVNVVAGNILNAGLESDGRMRTSYNVAGPITFRLASSKNVWDGGGNMQNILRDREDMDLFEQDLI